MKLLHLENDKKTLVDKEWLKKVLRSGTSNDKIAAITLRIQSAPFYRLQVNTEQLKMKKTNIVNTREYVFIEDCFVLGWV
jgi:hypothetical protein